MPWVITVIDSAGKPHKTIFPANREDVARNYQKNVGGTLEYIPTKGERKPEDDISVKQLRYVKPRGVHLKGSRNRGVRPVWS